MRAEPASNAPHITSTPQVSEIATERLAEVAGDMAADDYDLAFSQGSARSYDVAAKELIDSL